MYALFLSVVMSGTPNSNAIDNVTFKSQEACESYRKGMRYYNTNTLIFNCKKVGK
jgi:hypothetical protein